MARRIDDVIYERLRQRAARNGVSMEEEARQILQRAVAAPENLGRFAVQCSGTDGDGFGDPGFPANLCDDDTCPGFDDNLDTDGDGLPNGCDLCSGDNGTGDTDGDGLCADRDCDETDPTNTSAACRVFGDGFETGDTSAWSLTGG